jgi:hypothetical protein
MKTIDITSNGKLSKYKIPEKWSEIKVGEFMEIVKVETNDLLSDFQKSIDVINIVSGIPKDIIEDMDFDTEFSELVKTVDFLQTPVVEQEKDSVMIEGEEYFLKKDFDNKTAGEVASFDVIYKKNKSDLYTCLDELLPLFLRKKTDDGELERFKSSMMNRVDMFREKVNISDVLSLFFYFSGGSKVSLKDLE